MAEKSKDFFKYMSNPRSYTVKKWTMELIKEKYTKKQDLIIERITTSLHTDQDVEDLGSLLAAVYEAGYFKAVNDYKKEAEKLGLKVMVGNPESDP
jgi:ABC-type transport system involved in multi-copper enzyme maturation permease subunit